MKPDKQLSPEVVEAVADAIAQTEFAGDWRKDSVLTECYTIMAVAALRAALPILREQVEAEIRKDEREKTLKGFRMWVINYPETVKLVDEALGCNAEHGIDLNQERRSRCGN